MKEWMATPLLSAGKSINPITQERYSKLIFWNHFLQPFPSLKQFLATFIAILQPGDAFYLREFTLSIINSIYPQYN
jgi:hypothetical protein